ncbi:Clr6 histone deacetylase associated PHD protein-2 Cph2, partial [Teratosphaeriaceae sp. CCFEE 6253]
MQKAVHFRVFFWELSNAGYGNMVGFKSFTEKVGKIYWESARKMQKELLHAKSQGRPTFEDEVELLPEHLASLVELDCDDVLNDEMVQRAWNLAWNKPSAFNVTQPNAARDSVVEDHAIRSPLDAVAAWYANMVVDDTLLETLAEHPSTLNT